MHTQYRKLICSLHVDISPPTSKKLSTPLSYTPTHFLRPPMMILIFMECCLHKQLIYGIEGVLKLLCMYPLERSDHLALLTVMAEGRVKQVLEKEITCALCLDLFKEPKRLPCDHVYCKDCLRGLALQSLNVTISCPECRILTQVPGNDVNNLRTAFQTNRLIEAFQQVQIRVDTDSPNTNEMCQAHPTQPLAIYCETCKKQLCRDCILMSKQHASHEYGFFAEVAPKYREKITNKLSLIKTQKSSISSALGEIATAKSSIADHAQKCQDDVEQAFEELISVLKTCKQGMKDEATAYYSSLIGVFDQQKQRLKEIQGKIESVISSADTVLQDDDQSFLMRMESTFERINDQQKKLHAVSLTTSKPRLIGVQAMDADSLKHYMKVNCFICELAQADMCSVDLTNIKLYVEKQTSIVLTLRNSSGTVCQDGKNQIDIYLLNNQGSSTKGDVQPSSQGQVKILLTPKRQGQHRLNVKVNGTHIKNSPFMVTVYMQPYLLSKPVATILSGLKRPVSLAYSKTEDKIYVSIIDEGRIMIFNVNSQFRVTQREFIKAHNVNEITHDAALNMFFATTCDNQVHKLSSHGTIIKIIGQLGIRNAEFKYPNGLRVREKCELYVCDSNNNRVQVFDLELNFKRSFGKKGTGRGQFDFPADVDFDSGGNIYVTDDSNHRIQVFTLHQSNERHVRTISGEPAFQPVSIHIHDSHMYVTDEGSDEVRVMNITSGELVTKFGSGYLYGPEGITIDKDGYVYVTSHFSKVVIF